MKIDCFTVHVLGDFLEETKFYSVMPQSCRVRFYVPRYAWMENNMRTELWPRDLVLLAAYMTHDGPDFFSNTETLVSLRPACP